MIDQRLKTLAHSLVNYSCELKPGEKILIDATGCDDAFVEALVAEAYAVGGIPFYTINRPTILREFLMHAGEEQITQITQWDSERMQQMQAYIAVRGQDNTAELSDVPEKNIQLYQSIYQKQVHTNIRVKNTKWVVLRFPNKPTAQLANMSTRQFENFFFDVCNLDYSKMSRAMDALVKVMESTDKVRMTGPGTDIEFSIKGMPAIKCDGKLNIPDGEVYTAPVKNSINGTISYNTPSFYQSVKFENIKFTFKDGKIVDADANNKERINKILDTDEGARYIGEFSFGVNPYILSPMNETLFDEKITGSIHFTPGASYDDAYNGNESAVHWDLVWIQRAEWGGGDVYFDGELIRKDGIFVKKELECLNPENLK